MASFCTLSQQTATSKIEKETKLSQQVFQVKQVFFPDAVVTSNNEFSNLIYKEMYQTWETIDIS